MSNCPNVEPVEKYKQSIFFPWSKQNQIEPLQIEKAQGIFLHLKNGETLIDLSSRAFCANLGHNHQGMRKAISNAALNAQVNSLDTFCPMRLACAENLLTLSPDNMQKVFFTLGGAEANENAIKMARLFTKRHKIITRYRSYHGATLATINFSGDYRRIPFDNSMTGVLRFPDPYPRGSKQKIDTVTLLEEMIEIEGPETIAAIMLEGITGANGVFVPDQDYWPRIRKLCDKFGIILIADEILSGFYRTGKFFGVDHFDVKPDIITVAKGLTAGYAPLGAVIVDKKICAHFANETLWCGLTQYGNSLCCAAANAAFNFYREEKIQENVLSREKELKSILEKLKNTHENIAEWRSIGLLAAIDLKKNKFDESPLVPYRASGSDLETTKILQTTLKKNGISTVVRFSTILIAPPLNISSTELALAMEKIDRSLTEFFRK